MRVVTAVVRGLEEEHATDVVVGRHLAVTVPLYPHGGVQTHLLADDVLWSQFFHFTPSVIRYTLHGATHNVNVSFVTQR